METYLNVYKGYYVSVMDTTDLMHVADMSSSLETVLGVTTRDTTGSGAAWMTLSMSLGIAYQPQKLKLR